MAYGPTYSPYSGTRSDFTTGGDPTTLTRRVYDPSTAEYTNENYQSTTPVIFDQQGYLDAQLGHMGNYLGKFGSYQTNEQQSLQAQRDADARQTFQTSLPQAPQMNFQQSPQPVYTGGGWGQQSPMASSTPMTYRGQSPSGMLGTTNRGSHGGILGGNE